jgi:membrane-bound lytic murein transglycosylase D
MLPKQNGPEPKSNDFDSLKKQVNRLQKALFIVCIFVFGGVLSYLFIFSKDAKEVMAEKSEKPMINTSSNVPQSVSLPLSDPAVDFAGEKVPYAADFEIRERIDREILGNTFSHSRTMLVMKRAGRWFPVIEPILKANGVPEDLKYVAVIESDLGNVISPAGATGFWQFMKNTAPEFGLEVSEEVDERYDVQKSTEAACKYFKKAYAKFNSWTLAAASYNMGMAGVSKRLEEQKQNSYYDLDLNTETTRYVARILAMKSLFTNPKAYGFHISNADLYPQVSTTTVLVNSSITDLNVFAKENNTNLKILKELNPWLRKSVLTNAKGKTYEVKVPVADFNYQQAQKQIKGILPE